MKIENKMGLRNPLGHGDALSVRTSAFFVELVQTVGTCYYRENRRLRRAVYSPFVFQNKKRGKWSFGCVLPSKVAS
jgi:hypothetical protein